MRTILGFLLVILLFTACKKENDRAFTQSPEERVTETLNKYQTQLSGAQYGWKAFVETQLGGTYFFYFKFNNSNRVSMYSTFDSASAVVAKESSYRLKALQQVSLLFDTYSYLHVLSDPDPNTAGGQLGVGYGADFEFYFSDSSTADTIKLIGLKNETKTTLIRATQAEADLLDNQGLSNGFLIKNYNKYENYFRRITVDGVDYEVLINTDNRTITFRWLENGELKTATVDYYYSIGGINFSTPFVNGTLTINGFTNLTWDGGSGILGFDVNGKATPIIGTGQPLKVDLDAPQRFKQYAIDNANFWVSLNGWHINGVDDALHLATNVPNYNAAFYSPKEVKKYGWTLGDLGGVIFNASANFSVRASSYNSTISNGILKFTIQGLNTNIGFGTTLTPLQVSYITGSVNSFRSYMTSPDGYYLVQTSATSYDMVNAIDGKSWITWEF